MVRTEKGQLDLYVEKVKKTSEFDRLEMVEERDMSEPALGEAAGVLGLLDRVDGDGVGYRLDEARGVARDEYPEA